MRFVAPLCAAVVLFAAACAPKGETAVKDSVATAAPPVVDVAAVRQAIDQGNAKLVDALQRGDSVGLSASYDNDAVTMMSGMPAWRGKADIMTQGMALLKDVKFSDIKFNTTTVDVGGDFAIETGTYEMTTAPKGGKPAADKGKYVTVWKKQSDGTWKIYRDISNSDGSPKS
jgi:uncharacterized protein (TIGR02246 family)